MAPTSSQHRSLSCGLLTRAVQMAAPACPPPASLLQAQEVGCTGSREGLQDHTEYHVVMVGTLGGGDPLRPGGRMTIILTLEARDIGPRKEGLPTKIFPFKLKRNDQPFIYFPKCLHPALWEQMCLANDA